MEFPIHWLWDWWSMCLVWVGWGWRVCDGRALGSICFLSLWLQHCSPPLLSGCLELSSFALPHLFAMMSLSWSYPVMTETLNKLSFSPPLSCSCWVLSHWKDNHHSSRSVSPEEDARIINGILYVNENAEKLFILHRITKLKEEHTELQIGFYLVEYVWRQTFQR